MSDSESESEPADLENADITKLFKELPKHISKSSILHGKYVIQKKSFRQDSLHKQSNLLLLRTLSYVSENKIKLPHDQHITSQTLGELDRRIIEKNIFFQWIASSGVHVNVGIFDINQRNHAKFRVYNIVIDKNIPWMLFIDYHPLDFNNVEKDIGLICNYSDKSFTIRFTSDEVAYMLRSYKLPVPKELPPPKIVSQTYNDGKMFYENKNGSPAPVPPPQHTGKATKAGLLSLIRHKVNRNVMRVKKRISSKVNKSLSKTSTFTKKRISPHRYRDKGQISALKQQGYAGVSPTQFKEDPEMIKPSFRGWFKRSFNEPYQARKLYNELTVVKYTDFDGISRESTSRYGVPIGRRASVAQRIPSRTLARYVPVVNETE